jgi:dihydroorotate dehydrogenase
LLPFADYLVVNVSSPNTPDLRKLQETERLQRLLEALLAANRRLAEQNHTIMKPILVKIAPDLTDEEVREIAHVAQTTGISGLIATNTTITRPETLRTPIKEDGGLSGKPVAARADRRHLRARAGDGDVRAPRDAREVLAQRRVDD